MTRLMLVSADCHAGARPETYREYLPAKFHQPFDRWWSQLEAEMNARKGTFFDAESQEAYDKSESVLAGGTRGEWDPAVRVREQIGRAHV